MGSHIVLTAEDGFQVPAYMAEPSSAPRGAIVVLQEIFGVNAHMRHVVDGFAADGYVAIAPATFQRVAANVDFGYTPEEMGRGIELKSAAEALPAPGVQRDIQAAIAHVAPYGRVAVLGYCWGGLLAWRSAATASDIAAAVVYYGGGVTVGAEPERKPKVPVMAHFGTQDTNIPLDTVEKFGLRQPDVSLFTYPAGHGFNREGTPAWNAAAAESARARTMAFLAEHL